NGSTGRSGVRPEFIGAVPDIQFCGRKIIGANSMSLKEVKVPDIGDFKEVEVIEVLVKPGDTVEVDQSLITVESDKASMEIPSDAAGVVKELKVKLGDKLAEGSRVLVLATTGAQAAPAEQAPAAPPAQAAPAPASAPASA